ncbi:vascular endothelial growth factor D isoform X1 [Phyllostomus discolor]|uniref:Vascular endothelial growth factor D n=2 Tax=Phyllostomus discolor TaxID=89673 RepID=A0A7E6D135_9CHIR|nr:vascular endothelial growth factor D isoform X1 [Phyllostomus discolor]
MFKMYRQWAVVNIFMMSYLQLVQDSSYEHGPVKQSMLERSEQQIRAASGLEELLQITHFEDWKLWRCRLKLKSFASPDSRSASHRSTRFAATFYDVETLKVIDEEWQRTQCSPRETCVEVASELGSSTNRFFKPPCVNVFRCGGCCNEESVICMNTSTSYVSKQLFEISVPLTSVPELVPVKVANHTGCKCFSMAPSHPYPIIRRSIQVPEEDRCSHAKKLCPIDMLWDSNKCKCVLQEENPLAGMEDHSHLQELALCGPHMKFDEDRCECVCKTPCPRDLIQHPENCSCIECRESMESCCRKHKLRGWMPLSHQNVHKCKTSLCKALPLSKGQNAYPRAPWSRKSLIQLCSQVPIPVILNSMPLCQFAVTVFFPQVLEKIHFP